MEARWYTLAGLFPPKDLSMEYPKFRFHATEKEQIVTDPEHEDAVAHSDAGWVNHPSELAPAEPAAAAEPEKKPRKR